MKSMVTSATMVLLLAWALGTAAPPAQAQVTGQAAVGCQATHIVCCPQPRIIYRHHCLRRSCCCSCCTPAMQVVLELNQCSCCPIQVPVCVPGCCTGVPCVTERCGLFGRKITEYTWCCGFRVKIIQRRRGDIVVHTYGS